MQTIYVGQTYEVRVTTYAPDSHLPKNPTTIALSTYQKIDGVLTTIETALTFDYSDGIGIKKRYHYFDPAKYTGEGIIRLIVTWTIALGDGTSVSDLNILDVKQKKASG